MRRTILALLLVCLCLLTACSSAPQETTAPTASETTVPTETEPAETISPVAEEKEVIVYFANWYLDTKTAEEGAEVCSIPWDKVTCINHAFWAVEPADGSTETSWDRLAASGEPRTSFRVASTLPKADFDNDEPSRMAPGLPRNHFAQYQYYSEQYPDVKILISIGGWTLLRLFSPKWPTPPRAAPPLWKSCLDILEEYPWVDGFDIDWEYFGGSKDGARLPESEKKIRAVPSGVRRKRTAPTLPPLPSSSVRPWTTPTAPGVKRLTACASASTGWTLPMQNWRLVSPLHGFCEHHDL